jgi:hypothetical protein
MEGLPVLQGENVWGMLTAFVDLVQHLMGVKRYDQRDMVKQPLEPTPLSDITPQAEEIGLHHAVGHFHLILVS